jgi:hypothetical protein
MEAGLKATGVGLTGLPTTTSSSQLQCFDLLLPEGYQGSLALFPKLPSEAHPDANYGVRQLTRPPTELTSAGTLH